MGDFPYYIIPLLSVSPRSLPGRGRKRKGGRKGRVLVVVFDEIFLVWLTFSLPELEEPVEEMEIPPDEVEDSVRVVVRWFRKQILWIISMRIGIPDTGTARKKTKITSFVTGPSSIFTKR